MAFVNASGWEMEKEGVSRMEFSSWIDSVVIGICGPRLTMDDKIPGG